MTGQTAAMREWGPVGLFAGTIGAVLVWLGLTACTLPMPFDTDVDAESDVDLDIGNLGGSTVPETPGLAYIGHDSAVTSHGISIIEETVDDGGDGSFHYACQVAGTLLPNTPVRDLERATIEFDDGTTEDRLYTLVPTPGAASLRVLRMDGSEIRRIALPFVPKSFDLSSATNKAYVVEENGPSIVRIDLVANAIDLTALPMNGAAAAIRRPIDVRVIPAAGIDEIWISDGLLGGVVILNQSLTFAANIVLQPGVNVRIDYFISAGWDLIDAVTDGSAGSLWEIDRITRTAARILDAPGAPTISSAESATLVGFTGPGAFAYAAYHRTIGELSAEVGVSFEPGLTPVSQLTLDTGSFVALHDATTGGGSVLCLDLPAPIPIAANPSAFARSRFLFNVPAPPPAVTHLLTVNTTGGGQVSIDPPSPGGDGLYPEGTIVTVTAVPDAGFTATLTGFDSVAGLAGQVTMNAARTVDVTFTPENTATTVTFTTSALFRCTNGPLLAGCNTSTLSSRGMIIAFVGANRTELVDPDVPTVLGELRISCPFGECAELNFATLPASLEISVSQTAPSAAVTEFAGNGAFTGSMRSVTSTAVVTWAAGDASAEIAGTPTVRYELEPLSFSLPPPCPAGCPPATPPVTVTFTGRVVIP